MSTTAWRPRCSPPTGEPEGRVEPHEERGDRHEAANEGEDAEVDRELVEARHEPTPGNADHAGHDERERDSEGDAAGREHRALDAELPDDAAARGAEGGADRHFAVA